MTQIKITKDADSSYFIQQHSLLIRVWHWFTFFIIAGLILTVLMNSTIMNQRANIAMVQDQLKSKGVEVTEDQAFAVSREYEDKGWGVHTWLGYGLAFLFLSRIIIELVQPGEEKIRLRIKNALGLYKKNDENKTRYQHYIGAKYSYLLFYALLFSMTLTGLGLAFGNGLGFSRGLHDVIKEIHSAGQFLIYAFVLIHLCGVVIYENREHKGIVSGMINGNK